jgi:hypothetical protein
MVVHVSSLTISPVNKLRQGNLMSIARRPGKGTDAAAAVHRGAWRRGGVSARGAGSGANSITIGYLGSVSYDANSRYIAIYLLGLSDSGSAMAIGLCEVSLTDY